MTTRPATPLEVALGPDGDFWSKHGPATPAERQEIERRANSYPRLVEVLKGMVGIAHTVTMGQEEEEQMKWQPIAEALLRSLGESE